jgi:hypothetical protein
MSEFQEKLQLMKDSMIEETPTLISADSEDEQQEHLEEEQSSLNRKGTRKRNNLKGRLDAVLAENKAKDARQQHLISLLQEQEARLVEAQARAEQNAHNSNAYYEQSLENEEQRIITELKLAKENVDIEKEVELQHKLSEIAAQKQTQALSKTLKRQQQFQVPQGPPVNYPQPEYYPEQHTEAQVNEHLEDWLEDNSWANPNSPDYDPNLHAEVDDLAGKLNKHLRFKRASHMIGTPEYFKILSDEMNRRYSIEDENNDYDEHYEVPTQYEQPSIDNYNYAVAPVTKKGSSMADRYTDNRPSNQRIANKSSTRPVTLTKDEWEVGAKMAPMLSKIHGKHFSEEEAVAVYYKSKMKLPPEERLQPGSQLYKTYRNY